MPFGIQFKKKIAMDDLFDGRLEEHGIIEYIPKGGHVAGVRHLIELNQGLTVHSDENGKVGYVRRCQLNSARRRSSNGGDGIRYVIAELFDTTWFLDKLPMTAVQTEVYREQFHKDDERFYQAIVAACGPTKQWRMLNFYEQFDQDQIRILAGLAIARHSPEWLLEGGERRFTKTVLMKVHELEEFAFKHMYLVPPPHKLDGVEYQKWLLGEAGERRPNRIVEELAKRHPTWEGELASGLHQTWLEMREPLIMAWLEQLDADEISQLRNLIPEEMSLDDVAGRFAAVKSYFLRTLDQWMDCDRYDYRNAISVHGID